MLLIFYPWYIVLVGLLCVDLVWQIIQHAFVSLSLSEISCLVVVWLKWPAAVGSSIYLFVHGRYGVGILALLWLLLSSFITAPVDVLLGLLRVRRSLGSISLALARKIGYIPQDAQL